MGRKGFEVVHGSRWESALPGRPAGLQEARSPYGSHLPAVDAGCHGYPLADRCCSE